MGTKILFAESTLGYQDALCSVYYIEPFDPDFQQFTWVIEDSDGYLEGVVNCIPRNHPTKESLCEKIFMAIDFHYMQHLLSRKDGATIH